MKFNCEIELNGKYYKFESIEEGPLMFEMVINNNYTLYRHINCDDDGEYMNLVKKYIAVEKGISKPAIFSNDVYRGKEISSESFMKELLEHVLNGVV